MAHVKFMFSQGCLAALVKGQVDMIPNVIWKHGFLPPGGSFKLATLKLAKLAWMVTMVVI